GRSPARSDTSRTSGRVSRAGWAAPAQASSGPRPAPHLIQFPPGSYSISPGEGDVMTQTQLLKRIQRANWRALRKLVRRAYQEGFEAGLARAHGQGRRGRTIRGDATVEGLVRRIERHFGLDRYAFEVLIAHRGSKKRVPARDLLRRYRLEDKTAS